MNKEFQVHVLTEDGIAKAKLLASLFDGMLEELIGICGSTNNGREFAIVRTKLEEACFFAKKAMALSNYKED